MKHVSHVKTILCLIVALQLFGCTTSQAANKTGDQFGRKSGHPYLTYSDANIKKLKARIANEPMIAEAWGKMLASAERSLEPSGDQGRSRRRGGGNELLCLAYRMTGDKRFGEKAKASLISHQFGGRKSSMLMKRNPPWRAGLDAGDKCHSFASVYDTVYDLLTPQERKELASRCAEEGILPVLNDWVLGEERIHSLDTMGHNWWSAIVFGAGIASMAVLDEDPRAADWVNRVGAADAEWLRYAGNNLAGKCASFDRNGGFYESVSYAGYAIRSHLPFRQAWRDAFVEALPEQDVLGKIADFFMHVSYFRSGGSPWSTDFGDSSLGSNGGGVASQLWALGYRSPGMLWYMNQCRGARGRDGEASTSGLMLGSPGQLLYAPTAEEMAAMPELPDVQPSQIFPDMGWATMRSSWEKDATMLGIKCGYTWNHSHADTGSFILFHRGKYILVDSGKSGYSTPQYDDYYRQSVAHSVVMFNGRAENPEDTYFGSKFIGTTSHLLDAGDLRYVLADATGPTCDTFIRNFRHFVWVGDVILILDDLKTFEPGQFEWQLHYQGEGKRNGKDFTVTQDDVQVIVRPLFPMPFPDAGLPTDYPENMRLEMRMGLKDKDQHTEVPYAVFMPTELMRRTKFITAIMPVPEGDWQAPKIERLQTVDMIGLRITQHGKVTELWLNLLADGRIKHRNSTLVYDGWETDAYMIVQTWPGGADRNDPDTAEKLMIINGSYLRRDGKLVLDSLSKLYLCATKQQNALDVQVQGQPVINALLRAPKKPVKVHLNGQPVDPTYNKNAKKLWLSIRTN
jgi:oligo-alginate lyase